MAKFGPVAIYRMARYFHRLRIPFVPRTLDYLNRLLFCCWIPHEVDAGVNLELGYAGMGIVVHSEATLGKNVHIGQHVTIGGNAREYGVPSIGSDVYIGVGACILGPVTIGSGAIIGAHALVLTDIPSNSVAIGLPARVVKSNIDPSQYLYHLRVSGQER